MDKNNDNNEVQGFYTYNLGGESGSAPPPEEPPQKDKKAPGEQKPAQQRPPRQSSAAQRPQSAAPRQPTAAPRPQQSAPSGGAGAQKPPEGDFRVNFDFDGEYDDVPEDAPIRIRREKRTGCFGGALLTVFIVCVSVILASLMWLAATDVLGFGASDELVQVTVPKTFTVDDIAELLAENDLIKYESLFKLYSKFSDIESKILPGTYNLNKNFDYLALVRGMSSRGSRVTVDVTFPEGYTLHQIFQTLEEHGVCDAEDMWEAAATAEFDYEFLADIPAGDKHRLEGFLFPDTYTFYMGDTPTRVLTILLSNFNTKFKAEYYAQADSLGYTVRDIIIIASMIEREAKSDTDRPLIASVVYNRLKSDSYPRLEIDATIRYVIAETGEPFSIELDSPYNTYVAEGLPPGPISNPGIKSIQAALNPETTKYYFYALGLDGNHKFSQTFEEHTAFVNSDLYGG